MKAVIFDLGSVLVHYDHETTLRELSRISQADLIQIRAWSAAVSVRVSTGKIDGRALYQHLVEETGTNAGYQQFVSALCRSQRRNEEGLAYARQLQQRAGVTVGAISNTNEIHAQWMFEHVPELQAFDAVILSHQVGLLKPDPAIYHLALDRLQVRPSQAFFVDDQPQNVAAARKTGMAGVVHRNWATTQAAVEEWLRN